MGRDKDSPQCLTRVAERLSEIRTKQVIAEQLISAFRVDEEDSIKSETIIAVLDFHKLSISLKILMIKNSYNNILDTHFLCVTIKSGDMSISIMFEIHSERVLDNGYIQNRFTNRNSSWGT